MRNAECGIKTTLITPHSPFPIPIPHSPRRHHRRTGAWWGTATIGFVGGSLFTSRGGQNMIEPAAYGVATCFGPNTQNFRDVVELLLSNQAAVRVTTGAELTAFVRSCLERPAVAADLGNRASRIVLSQQGAIQCTLALLAPLLSTPATSGSIPGQRSAAA